MHQIEAALAEAALSDESASAVAGVGESLHPDDGRQAGMTEEVRTRPL